MDTFILENEYLKISISCHGAELQSIWSKASQRELLWQGDPAFWRRRSPILFPIVGRLKEDSYQWKGQLFSLTQHGFARDLKFIPQQLDQETVVFVLAASGETLSHYPFHFELKVTYHLQEKALHVSYQIINEDEDEMYYSIGAHPAFSLQGPVSNYRLQFSKPITSQRTLIADGLRTASADIILRDNTILELDEGMFSNDAIIIEKIQAKSVTMLEQGEPYISLAYSDFDHLGIWKKPEAPFLCIEPWNGLADRVDASGKLEEKEAIRQLVPNGQETFSYTINYHK